MKIDIGESLACSYLRHVKCCWIVQANWKTSEHWERCQDADLEARYSEMKQHFDPKGSVFKQTAAEFLKQGEIDVVGIDQQSEVHAMEVAFHGAGLNYGDSTSADNVLKKMLRTLFILRTYHSSQTPVYIYFLSPKVGPTGQSRLETVFANLRRVYADVEWRLLTNDHFAECIVKPTLEKASEVTDLSELFVRSTKLLEIAGYRLSRPDVASSSVPTRRDQKGQENKLQPLVQELMRTLLVVPSLLNVAEKESLTDKKYCRDKLALKIGNHGLIRGIQEGKEVNGHPRYWAKPYGGFYVCSQWPKDSHCDNPIVAA